jgi:hypothetical protein
MRSGRQIRARPALARALATVSLGGALGGAVGGAVGLAGCSGPPPAEIGEGPCSNGLDDDRDMLTDCADPACRLFAWCVASGDAGRPDAGSPDAALPDAPGLDAGPLRCEAPLDVVLVLDVSSSTPPDLARLRDGAPALFEALSAASTDPRLGLVVFVDDALAVDDCAPIAGPEALAAALDEWRAFSSTNTSPVSRIPNVDCVENSLDALATAITGCAWRDGGRVIVHLTDDTFAERPAVLSGPFGPGVVVTSTYLEVSDALAREGIVLGALARDGAGAACGGPTPSPDVGRGFHRPFGAEVSLPERTGGAVWDLDAMRRGELDPVASIAALLERVQCAP